MKRYRSKKVGPLPIRLNSGSISVASKGYFRVEDDDLLSPDLLTKKRMFLIEEVDENGRRIVPGEAKAKTKAKPKKQSSDDPEVPIVPTTDVSEDEKDDDSLTSSSEMVESDSDETDSGDAETTDYDKEDRRRRFGGKGKTKKGISG